MTEPKPTAEDVAEMIWDAMIDEPDGFDGDFLKAVVPIIQREVATAPETAARAERMEALIRKINDWTSVGSSEQNLDSIYMETSSLLAEIDEGRELCAAQLNLKSLILNEIPFKRAEPGQDEEPGRPISVDLAEIDKETEWRMEGLLRRICNRMDAIIYNGVLIEQDQVIMLILIGQARNLLAEIDKED